MLTTGDKTEASASDDEFNTGEDLDPLRCWDCNVNFTSRHFLYNHLLHHIKQPQVSLTRVNPPSLKICIKNKSGNSYEVVNSPTSSTSAHNSPPGGGSFDFNLADNEEDEQNHGEGNDQEKAQEEMEELEAEDAGDVVNVSFSPNIADIEASLSPSSENSNSEQKKTLDDGDNVENSETSDYGSIPGTDATPPPDSCPEYPKIRIKTTGLLKEPLTITEITDDNPDGDPNAHSNRMKDSLWSSHSMEDPLKLPGSDDTNLMSLFSNTERAKDLGFTTSDSEFISLDRLDERNNALQLYNSGPSNNQNALTNLTGLPMEALAQQVSRLQPSGNGMHQQNVLINIQQFPQAPPVQAYQPPPPMYHHPHPSQPMYHPSYQYQPPNPIYYPPAPGYPQHMPPPPQPPIGQPQMVQGPPQTSLGQPQMVQGPPQTSQPQVMNPGSQPYRQSIGPRQAAPRQMAPGQRMPMNPRQTLAPRQPMTRPRAPMVRPRGGGMSALRGVRPRMPMPQNGQIRPQQQHMKRTPEQIQSLQAKKKRFDVLTPDKDDDDCQVICMQPKNTDGGLPQIQSVQGGTPEPAESSVMHLSDSITLSVRNPQTRPQSPKKSDAKAVANILATRGITVTATPKPKEKDSPQKNASLPTSLNLNGAVSIIPSAKNANSKASNNASHESQLPTVDLTDDTSPMAGGKSLNSSQKQNQRPGLPFKCDLCPAQYPNAMGLSKHRQNYHKTAGGMCEIGIPLVNLKQPGIFQKLTSFGIFNYIPLPSSGPDGTFAFPIINSRSGNAAGLGATTMLTLGPIRTIPRPQNNVPNGAHNANKQMNVQK